jgi:lipoprotein-anchoring transpeptidase ErfK/SrfK
MFTFSIRSAAVAAITGAVLTTAASANPFSMFGPVGESFYPNMPGQESYATQPTSYPPESGAYGASREPREPREDAAGLPSRFKRQVVDLRSTEAPGTVIIDTPNTYLYLVLGHGKALRYGIGVGREGFTWSGTQTVTRKAEWPDWTPPEEMLARQPYLPRFMAGGPGNPLGARAMYLGGTIYRIHGTNQPETIGGRVSSGCIRLTNDDVADLYGRVNVGTRVIVLPATRRAESPIPVSTRVARPLQLD